MNSPTMSLGVSFSNNENNKQPMQVVQFRLSRCSDLVFGASQQTIQRSPPTLFADSLLPFPLREPFLSKTLLDRFLSSFNLSTDFSIHVFNTISSFANQSFAGNPDLNFHIVANINFLSRLCIDNYPTQTPVDGNNNGASLSAIHRLMNHKFDADQLGITEQQLCTICSDDLIQTHHQKDLTKIPCGHTFHQSCIVRWLLINNSCPLCRAKLQDLTEY